MFNFERQVDGSYLIYARKNMTTNLFLHVTGSSLYVQLSGSSFPVNQTYYLLEYQLDGTFRIKVKSLGYYIAKSGAFLSLTNESYGDNGKFLIETANPAWDVIFQIPNGSPYNIYQAFLHGTKQLMTNSCDLDSDGTCKYSFIRKDGILRDWWNGCLSVCKIKYSLINNNMVVLDFVFDGVNTSPETWFVATKLQSSNDHPDIIGLSL
ncbi:hypothetical protein CHS0354_026693 [Potamilus streckersoni]|uniref:Uncharacterized protein n=1 Tax=Potamilus streckersoni TaxID=2493646 RepID=A0AAE0S826_9BIVA|nr:hypothetical protein CHS0354_026693 [Potamilus streckersoni]